MYAGHKNEQPHFKGHFSVEKYPDYRNDDDVKHRYKTRLACCRINDARLLEGACNKKDSAAKAVPYIREVISSIMLPLNFFIISVIIPQKAILLYNTSFSSFCQYLGIYLYI